MQHPNLFFSKHDAEIFYKKIKTDNKLRQRYEQEVSSVEECLKEEFITEKQANGRNTISQHADFGSLNKQANKLCSVLGTKYIIEGDIRCAQRLKELLLHLVSFERWYGVDYTKRIPVPWHSDLCSTATTLALAKIYDLIFDYLTPDEQKTIADEILKKGVYAALGDWVMPKTRIHAIDSMGHNWWSVCISEAASAFLALSDFVEENKKMQVLTYVDNALADYLTYPGNRLYNKFGNFDDQGLFYESINYNNYGTGSLLQYLWCNERYFGRNETIRKALPEGLCDAAIKFSYPCTRDGKLFYEFLNFGDHSPGTEIDYLAKTSILTGIDSSAMRACASTYGNSLWDEIRGEYRPQELKGNTDYLPKNAFYSSGYAISRSSWESDATLLAIKSGYCWNHSHNDSGSFIIFHKGKPIFIDSGRCDYDSPFYHAYYCQDSAHSVLRIGTQGRRDEELYRGTRFPGSLSDHFESRDFLFVQADSTGPMAHLCSRMYRNFLWFDNRILVIFDDIYCHDKNTVEFTLHSEGKYKICNNKVDFSNGECCAQLISHEPESVTVREQIGHLDHKENENKPYLELSTVEKKRTHLLINTIELDNDKHSTEYTKLNSANASGLRITEKENEHEIWFNHMADGHVMHDNSNNVIEGFDTDAYMLVITRNKSQNTEQVLMICGSYLRRNGKVYTSDFVKKTQIIITSD